jgi:hypothetical protein
VPKHVPHTLILRSSAVPGTRGAALSVLMLPRKGRYTGNIMCMMHCMYAGGVKKAGDVKCPDKLHFLSFMVMELLGPSVGYFSLECQTYTTNTKLFVSHGLGMLKVSSTWHDMACVLILLLARNSLLPQAQLRSLCQPCSLLLAGDLQECTQMHALCMHSSSCLLCRVCGLQALQLLTSMSIPPCIHNICCMAACCNPANGMLSDSSH